ILHLIAHTLQILGVSGRQPGGDNGVGIASGNGLPHGSGGKRGHVDLKACLLKSGTQHVGGSDLGRPLHISQMHGALILRLGNTDGESIAGGRAETRDTDGLFLHAFFHYVLFTFTTLILLLRYARNSPRPGTVIPPYYSVIPTLVFRHPRLSIPSSPP